MKFSLAALAVFQAFSLASAQAADAAAKPTTNFMTSMLPMLAIMFVVIYFFMIRPEQKKQKDRQKLLSSVKKGDRIVTVGGMYGTVGNVKEDSLMVKIAEDTVVEFRKSAIANVLNTDGSDKVDDKKTGKKEDKQ